MITVLLNPEENNWVELSLVSGNILTKPAETDESGKEITLCYWKVSYEDHSYVHHGQIDGNTGEWTEFLQGIIRIR